MAESIRDQDVHGRASVPTAGRHVAVPVDGSPEALATRARKVIPGGVNSNFRTASEGRFFASAKGSRLIDTEGTEYVDYVLGMGVALLGHSPAAVIEQVCSAERRLQCPAGQHEAEVELAEKIVGLVPSAELVRIGCTGSEMVQLAMRVARAATGRRLVVKFEGHYHGWFDNIFAGTTVVAPNPGLSAQALAQSAGQAAAALQDLVVLPWNDITTLESFLEARGHEVAAIIMEPICCNTSVIVPRPTYLAAVRSLCDSMGIALVFDEVISGFRFAPGGAQELLGVLPDLTVLGKALGAGYPVAALAGRASLMELISTGGVMHGGTYNANAMAVAAARASLDTITAEGKLLYEKLGSLAGLLADRLIIEARKRDLDLVVMQTGPVLNTTFDARNPIVDYRSYHETNLTKQRHFLDNLEAEGVRVTNRGTWFLSLAHTPRDLEITVDAAGRALDRLASHCVPSS